MASMAGTHGATEKRRAKGRQALEHLRPCRQWEKKIGFYIFILTGH